MTKSELAKRYCVYVLGIYVMAMGLALIITSSLGVSPISSWAFVMSKNTVLSVGAYTFLVNIGLIAGQCLVLHHRGLRSELSNIALQIPFSFLFAAFIDINIWLLDGLTPHNYLGCFFMLLLGCIVQAYGIVFEVRAGVTMMSGEAFVSYVSARFSKEFGGVKVMFDVSMVLLAVCSALYFEPSWESVSTAVREGTIIAALSVGQLVRHISKRGQFVDRWCRE